MKYNQEDVIFHYTTGNILQRILEQHALLPDRNEPQNLQEIPTVTFSADPEWEKTRYRVGKTPDGQLVLLDKSMLQKHDGGLYRIVVSRTIAPLDWFDIKKQCNISGKAIKSLYNFALTVGARMKNWYATTESVSEENWIAIERLDENNIWVDLPGDSEVA